MASSTSSILLLLYVVCETTRVNYAYYAFHNFPQISPVLISIFAELSKLAVSISFLGRGDKCFSLTSLFTKLASNDDGGFEKREILSFALPAALYLINNLIYYTVLPFTTPSMLQVCMLAKLPTTGILHHFMIKKQHNPNAWVALFCLCVGLGIFNIPTSSTSGMNSDSSWYLPIAAGSLVACLSALASIFTETSTKEGEFWRSQTYLYIWGTSFATLSYPVLPRIQRGIDYDGLESKDGYMFVPMVVLVTITAGTGLVVAAILRARDNILKIIGTAASLITVAITQFVLFAHLRAATFTPWRVCGGSLVGLSTWCYNHYSQQQWPDGYSLLDRESNPHSYLSEQGTSEDVETTSEVEKQTSTWATIWLPDATKVLACLIVIAFVTMELHLAASA